MSIRYPALFCVFKALIDLCVRVIKIEFFRKRERQATFGSFLALFF